VRSVFLMAVTMVLCGAGASEATDEAGLLTVKALSLTLSLEAAQAALSSCTAQGFKVSVNIVDRNGTVKVLLVGDGARPFTADFARRKAYTASMAGVSSSDFAQRLQSMADGGKGMLAMDSNLVPVGGGLPITVGSDVIAAIGVSGAPDPTLDQTCAQAGIGKIKPRLN
jgi:uncharacterized protein GlcG (DUF336 family)